MTSEDRRQALHLGVTAFALTLRWLEPWQAWTLAGAAVGVNWLLLPALGWDRDLRREGSPFADGVKLYPIAVLAVLLLFPSPPQVAAAAAWGVMGVGDAASNVVGRRLGRGGFLGRGDRSFAGSLAFILTAWPAALGFAMFVGRLDAASVWLPALAAAGAGAAAEFASIPRRLDDNLPIALAAGAAFHLASG